MKVQKLVYYAHGWHLGLADAPLIGELVEAWRWGPVIRSLYAALAEFGNQPILTTLKDMVPRHAGPVGVPRRVPASGCGRGTTAMPKGSTPGM